MNQSSEYLPIPVASAKQIGIKFDKQVVIITAWDEKHGLIHTTTWGESARHKEWAAELGPQLAAAAGGLPGLAKRYEDFREPSAAAKSAAQASALRLALLNIAGTARKWAVSQGGDTPLAIIGKLARDSLGMTPEQVDAEIVSLNREN